MTRLGRRFEIRGVVQGVGFRPWIYRVAVEEGLTGRVRNDEAGVVIDAFGSEEALDMFMRRLESSGPPAADMRSLRAYGIPSEPAEAFSISPSERSEAHRRLSIPPDLATCPACLAEIFDPANRRYRYAFTNCTACGPRFTIARDVPYDRRSTTMAAFAMCPECRREFDDVCDRRFHAQPNACAVCGPRLGVVFSNGQPLETGDPIVAAAQALVAGMIVAVKGLGGFHLACDATSSAAIRLLRVRKRRDEKPFAVMVADLASADALAHLSNEERHLLESVERPIVLARRREGGVAAEVAPDSPWIGLMLAYTPLHHLLLRDAARPLVMTSANLSDEPLVYRNDEALSRLRGIADLFLWHDRAIDARCDDSVAGVVAGRPTVLRRSRGYVPRPVAVPHPFSEPVLACGAMLKNTFCIGVNESAYLGPHVGDLENVETSDAYEEAIARAERILRVEPEIVACDLHPDYASTRYALERNARRRIAVQHHHAHVASAMAEHGLAGPVIGVAYDGTGYGTDGTAWGGEVLIATYQAYERAATIRPIPLAGGDAAIRNPWRIALALLDDAYDGAPPLELCPPFSRVSAGEIAVVRQMIAARLRSPLARGVGRYFDGIGSLVLGRRRATYEGQIALAWNAIAEPGEGGTYDFDVDRRQAPFTLDLRPLVRAVVGELAACTPPSIISARFHNTIAAATAALVRDAAVRYSRLPVVLTGGCFQNPLLAARVVRHLAGEFDVRLHEHVPPGDGGIALGQAVIAAAIAAA